MIPLQDRKNFSLSFRCFWLYSKLMSWKVWCITLRFQIIIKAISDFKSRLYALHFICKWIKFKLYKYSLILSTNILLVLFVFKENEAGNYAVSLIWSKVECICLSSFMLFITDFSHETKASRSWFYFFYMKKLDLKQK